MYAIYAYIVVVWGVNVGIYPIHGVSRIYIDCLVSSDMLLALSVQR